MKEKTSGTSFLRGHHNGHHNMELKTRRYLTGQNEHYEPH